MGIKWNYSLGAKGGQDVKIKKGDEIVTDKSSEFGLNIKLKGVGNDADIEATIHDIFEKTDGLEEVSLKFSGPQHVLKKYVAEITKIVAANGGQQTLDLHIEDEIKASH